MSKEKEHTEKKPFEVPEPPPAAERSLELPAVIIGDRGEKDAHPAVRLLPGRVPESLVLYPAYALALLAGLLGAHWGLTTGELSPFMILLAWSLLFCWYWVYGVAYRYRRWLMKTFALFMSIFTALALTFFAALRAASLYLPDPLELSLRGPQPVLFLVASLTVISLAAIVSHLVYLGRGYRQKAPPVVHTEPLE